MPALVLFGVALLLVAGGSGLFLSPYSAETAFARNGYRGADLVSVALVVSATSLNYVYDKFERLPRVELSGLAEGGINQEASDASQPEDEDEEEEDHKHINNAEFKGKLDPLLYLLL